MRGTGPAILVLSALIIAPVASPAFSGEPPAHRLFFDEFSGPLSRRWVPFSAPGPRIRRARGNPAPSLDNYGGGPARNGVISKRLFRLEAGLVVRADIFVAAGAGEEVFGGSIGFPRDPEVISFGQWPEWLVGMSYDYIGRTDWSRAAVPEGGTLTCVLIDEDGRLEISRQPYRNRWLSGWHTFEIAVLPGGFVEFRIDEEKVYSSRRRISHAPAGLPLVLGHLSGRRGRVFHDNVEVLARPGASAPVSGPGE